jgi:hypothetical protein
VRRGCPCHAAAASSSSSSSSMTQHLPLARAFKAKNISIPTLWRVFIFDCRFNLFPNSSPPALSLSWSKEEARQLLKHAVHRNRPPPKTKTPAPIPSNALFTNRFVVAFFAFCLRRYAGSFVRPRRTNCTADNSSLLRRTMLLAFQPATLEVLCVLDFRAARARRY